MNWITLASRSFETSQNGSDTAWIPTSLETAIACYGFLHKHQIAPGGRLRFEAWGFTSQIAASSTGFRIRPMRINPGQATSDGQPLMETETSMTFATAASGYGAWHYACDVVVVRTDWETAGDIKTLATASYNWTTAGTLATTSNPTVQGVPTTTSVSFNADSLVFMASTIGSTSTLARLTPVYASISLVDSYHDQGVFDCLI